MTKINELVLLFIGVVDVFNNIVVISDRQKPIEKWKWDADLDLRARKFKTVIQLVLCVASF